MVDFREPRLSDCQFPHFFCFHSLLPSFVLSSLYYSNQCLLQEVESGCVKPIKNSVRIFALIGSKLS